MRKVENIFKNYIFLILTISHFIKFLLEKTDITYFSNIE